MFVEDIICWAQWIIWFTVALSNESSWSNFQCKVYWSRCWHGCLWDHGITPDWRPVQGLQRILVEDTIWAQSKIWFAVALTNESSWSNFLYKVYQSHCWRGCFWDLGITQDFGLWRISIADTIHIWVSTFFFKLVIYLAIDLSLTVPRPLSTSAILGTPLLAGALEPLPLLPFLALFC